MRKVCATGSTIFWRTNFLKPGNGDRQFISSSGQLGQACSCRCWSQRPEISRRFGRSWLPRELANHGAGRIRHRASDRAAIALS